MKVAFRDKKKQNQFQHFYNYLFKNTGLDHICLRRQIISVAHLKLYL